LDLKDIGSKIARLREANGISAGVLAKTIGISRGYLSRVENGHQVPSLVILDAVVREFGLELDYFFSGSSTGEVSVHSGAGSAVTGIPPKATFSYEALCGSRRHKLAQPFVAIFRPGAVTKVAIHDAEYFRYVLEGRIIFRFKGETHDLKAGDAIYHDATAGQEIECVGKTPAKLLTIFVKPAQLGAAAMHAGRLSADPGRAMVLEGHL